MTDLFFTAYENLAVYLKPINIFFKQPAFINDQPEKEKISYHNFKPRLNRFSHNMKINSAVLSSSPMCLQQKKNMTLYF